MGYRSDVGLVMNKKCSDKFQKELQSMNQTDAAEIIDFLSSTTHQKTAENGDVLFIWEYIKWYLTDSVVHFIIDFLNNLDYDGEEQYLFCIVGEEMDDCSIGGQYYENPFGLNIIRQLTYDV